MMNVPAAVSTTACRPTPCAWATVATARNVSAAVQACMRRRQPRPLQRAELRFMWLCLNDPPRVPDVVQPGREGDGKRRIDEGIEENRPIPAIVEEHRHDGGEDVG